MNSNEQTPFDWSIVDKLNPENIVGQSEMKSVRSFVKMVLNTDFQGLPQSSFVNRDFSKLLILFQATIKLLYASQKQLQNMCSERSKKYKEAAEEIAKLRQSEASLKKYLHSEQCQSESCPICKKRFKTIEFIDKHIGNRHKEHLPAWEFIRGFTDLLPAGTKIIDNESRGDQINDDLTKLDHKEQQNFKEVKKEIKLKFIMCNSITIENSLSQSKKKEQYRTFELDEEDPQPDNNDNFVNNLKDQVPPIQNITKLSNVNNVFNKNQYQNLSNNNLINQNINQVGISNNDQMTKSQIDMVTNIAASNIINGFNEIAKSHKKHYSTPQTPKENSTNYDAGLNQHILPSSPLPNPNYQNSKTPDQGKRTKVTISPPEDQSQTQIQRKEKHHHHHHQQQQQMQQIPQENAPQTPPATSCRKQLTNEQECRPSTTGSVTPDIQKQKQLKYQQQQQQQILSQKQKIQQQQQQQILPQKQKIQQQQQQIHQQQQVLQLNQQQEIREQQKQDSQFEYDQKDPFLLENDDENDAINSKRIEFTTAQLDDLIQKSDNEDGPSNEAEPRPQTPKKKRKKRRVIQMPDSITGLNGEPNQISNTTTINNNAQEVKFNFKGTKNANMQNQPDSQENDNVNESQKLKARKPNATFTNTDENYDASQPNQQNRKEVVKIGIVKRIDTENNDAPETQVPENVKNAKNDHKTVKRMGGYEIPNSELDNIIQMSSYSEQYDD